MRADRFDAAIVGGGPAGAWTACLLAARGARVLLLDGSHPREKPCGGGVTRRALALAARAIEGARLPAVSIRSVRFGAGSGEPPVDVPLGPGALVVASRADFDGLLFDAARRAGARIVAERATAVRRSAYGFEIETLRGIYRASWLVGADGAGSLVRRRVGRPFRRDQLSIATGFFAHGAASDEIVIEFVADPPGYIWSFPRPGHLAVGICAQAEPGATAPALRRIAADWLTRTALADGARLEPYAWPIPSLAAEELESLEPAGPGWLLVGDAAGLVDPLTREGIYFALASASFAADAIASGGADAWRAYGCRVRDELGGELARAARLKRRFFTPAFTSLLLDALARSRPVRAVMADVVSGEQGYRTLAWRLLRTFELGLAVELLFGLRRSAVPRHPSSVDS